MVLNLSSRTLGFSLAMLAWAAELPSQTGSQQRAFGPGQFELPIGPEKTGVSLYADSHALIVGNSDYDDGIGDLPGVKRDVRLIEETLRAHGFRTTVLTNATKRGFESELIQLRRGPGSESGNRIVVYYAGHGYSELGPNSIERGYLVMSDAASPATNRADFDLALVPMENIVAESRMFKARHVMFVFDSCFSGAVLNFRDPIGIPPGIRDELQHDVRIFLTAGRSGQRVPDNSGFARCFVDMLMGLDREPVPDGYVTGEELGFYLKHKVPSFIPGQNPQFGKLNDPYYNKGDIVFKIPGAQPENPERAPAPTPATPPVQPETTPRRFARRHTLDVSVGSLLGDDAYPVFSAAMTPEGQYAIVAAAKPEVPIYDLDTGTQVGALRGHQSWVSTVQVSFDGSLAASSDSRGLVRVWDFRTRTTKAELGGFHETAALFLVFSNSGQSLASFDRSGKIAVWRTSDGSRVGAFNTDASPVSVGLSPLNQVCVYKSPTDVFGFSFEDLNPLGQPELSSGFFWSPEYTHRFHVVILSPDDHEVTIGSPLENMAWDRVRFDTKVSMHVISGNGSRALVGMETGHLVVFDLLPI